MKPDLVDQNEKTRRQPPRSENEEENKLKWAAAARFAALRGWEFEVIRESAIRTPYLKNAKFLLRYLERDFQTHHEADMLECLKREGPMSIEALTRRFSVDIQSRAMVLPTCYRLIGRQQVGTDLMQPLSLNSILTPINVA